MSNQEDSQQLMAGNHGVAASDVPHEWPGIWNPAVAILKNIEEEGSQFSGPVNPLTGLRNGHGKLIYKDGTYYLGNFIEGLKHGQGEQTRGDGSTYIGGFENDLMHGEGKMTLADGKVIQTTWVYGRKHGKGMVVEKDNSSHYNCVFYHDMENMLEKTSSNCYDRAFVSMIFSAIAVGSLFPAIYISPLIFIATGVCYLILLISWCCSSTRKFLNNVMSVNDVHRYLRTLADSPP